MVPVEQRECVRLANEQLEVTISNVGSGVVVAKSRQGEDRSLCSRCLKSVMITSVQTSVRWDKVRREGTEVRLYSHSSGSEDADM